MILQYVGPYRVVEPMYEGIRVILNYRGETYSPAYVQGISGAGFHIGGICPCAPTCTEGIEPIEMNSTSAFLNGIKTNPLTKCWPILTIYTTNL